MRKLSTLLFGLAAVCCTLFFAKDTLFVWGTKKALHKQFQSGVAIKSMNLKKGVLSVEKMHIHADSFDLSLQQASCPISFQQLLKNPKVAWNLISKKTVTFQEVLLITQEKGGDGIHAQGSLQIGEDRFYFQISPHERAGGVLLALSTDMGSLAHPPMLAHLQKADALWQVEVSINQVAADKLLTLAAFVDPKQCGEFQDAEGTVELHSISTLNELGEWDKVVSHFSLDQFALSAPAKKWALRLEEAKGSFSYPEGINHEGFPLWKRMQCKANIVDGACVFQDSLALSQISGEMQLDPYQDPVLDLTGYILEEDRILGLHLAGHGAVHDDRAYWLEFTLDLNDQKGTHCGAILSICSPEAETVVAQLELEKLLPNQIEMLREQLIGAYPALAGCHVVGGEFSGKVVSIWEQGYLKQLQLEPFSGEGVVIEENGQPHVINDFTLKGSAFGQLQCQANMPTVEILGLFGEQIKQAYFHYRPDEIASVECTFDQKVDHTQVSAHIELADTGQIIQFGYLSPKIIPQDIYDVSDGWVYAEGLSHLVYGPFVRLCNENVEIYGIVDLIGSLDKGHVDCSLQIQEFLSKHPFLDIKSPEIGQKGVSQGSARFTYDHSTKTMAGTIPLKKTRIYDRQYGLCLKDVDGALQFSPNRLKVDVTQSEILFDRQPLLDQAGFTLSYDGQFKLENLKSRLCLPTNKDFHLFVEELTKSRCKASLYDEKDPLLTFAAAHDDHWTGEATLASLSKPLQFSVDWNPITNDIQIGAQQPGMTFRGHKSQNSLKIDEFEIGDILMRGTVKKETGLFHLADFSWSRPDLCIDGKGTFTIALPTKENYLEVHGDLIVETRLPKAGGILLKASHPFKMAYSPSMGFALSDMQLFSEACKLNISELEYKAEKKTMFAHGFSVDLTQDLLDRFVQGGVIPPLVKDIAKDETIQFHGSGIKDPKVTQLRGIVQQKARPLSLLLSLTNDEQSITLYDEENQESLQINGSMNEGNFAFNSVKGAYGGVVADLKKSKKDKLQGALSINTQTFANRWTETMTKWFPFETIGESIQLDGIFRPAERLSGWSYKGRVKAIHPKWFGHALSSIETKAEVTSDNILLESLDLNDDLAKLWVSEGALVKNLQKGWDYRFPEMELRNIQPQLLMEKIGKPGPFSIKSLSLKKMQGTLGNLNSMQGEGTCRFSNLGKKGEKTLPSQFPITHLRQMGIDPSSIIPVVGDAELVIGNERIYFTKLDGMFSEKKKYSYIPLKNTPIGYLDFSGELNMNIQAKPTQTRGGGPLVQFSVRGNVLEPSYTIR